VAEAADAERFTKPRVVWLVMESASTYHARFGNLSGAYQLIGYVPKGTAAKRQAMARRWAAKRTFAASI
jgi:hypothetical protein